jgi:hypothetical protein
VKSSSPAHDFSTWCESHGFTKITSQSSLQPGDIVFLAMDTSPHVYILGKMENNGLWQRYDCGSQTRIQSEQPFVEPVSYDNKPFSFAYRMNLATITWSSKNKKIVQVNQKGKISALKAGKTTVRAVSGEDTYVYKIKVVDEKFTGIREENGVKYYYKNGKKYTGFRLYRGNKYYYKKGKKVYGLQTIQGKTYYFSRKSKIKGAALTGWHRMNGNYYYYSKKTGAMQKNKKIGKYQFDENGVCINKKK